MKTDPQSDASDIRCVLAAGPGRLVLTAWPGLRIAPRGIAWVDPEAAAMTLDALRRLGVTCLVALCEAADLPLGGLAQNRAWARARGLRPIHAPISDYRAPDARFLSRWQRLGPLLHHQIDQDAGVALACSFGAGRSGTIAALLLCERGMHMPEAIRRVRAGFAPAIEAAEQERWLIAREKMAGPARC